MQERLDELEIRYSHQEQGLEALTQQVLQQQKQIEVLQGEIDYLKSLVQEMAPSAVAPMSEETPPPHY